MREPSSSLFVAVVRWLELAGGWELAGDQKGRKKKNEKKMASSGSAITVRA